MSTIYIYIYIYIHVHVSVGNIDGAKREGYVNGPLILWFLDKMTMTTFFIHAIHSTSIMVAHHYVEAAVVVSV